LLAGLALGGHLTIGLSLFSTDVSASSIADTVNHAQSSGSAF